MIMHNRNFLPLKALMLAGIAAIAFPGIASAQTIASDWGPMDDSAPAGDVATAQDALVSSPREKPLVDVTPYLEVQQVLFADLNGGNVGSDVLTYTTLAAGVDASVATRRAEAQVSVRYERVFGYDNQVQDQDYVSGVARGSLQVSRNLSLEAGAFAGRGSVDSRGSSRTAFQPFSDNVTQVYSAYAGPTFTARAGELDVSAAYRIGYTKVEDASAGPLAPGQTPIDVFDDSVSHLATASVGMQPGTLPFGWTVSAAYEREDAGQLDSRYEGAFVRGDVIVPITDTLAAVGGVGYEKIKVTERDALRDALGAPVVGSNGRLVTDPASPRLIAYESDGIIWDAGVLWRPSRRTALEARYGHRYGTDTYIGSFTYTPNERMGINVAVYDSVSGFGGALTDALSELPTQFRSSRNPLTGDLNGCAFSAAGGFCLNNALRTANSATFRSRGVQASISEQSGPWSSGLAAGYDRRKFLANALGGRGQISGLIDENYYVTGYLGRELDQRSSIEANVYGVYNDPGQAGAPDSYGFGANAAYYRSIWRGLSASVAAGIDTYETKGVDKDVTASALLGLRYSF
jgi:hypothetical protein